MGTAITLDVGAISLTYSKNHPGIDHGCLFRERDLAHYAERWSDGAEPSQGYRAKLGSILP